MDIISLKFVLAVFLSGIFFYLIPYRFRPLYLTTLSCLFISLYSIYLCIYVIAFSLINYFLGIQIEKSKYRLLYFRIGIFFNIGQIIVLKYSSFALDPLLFYFDKNISVASLSELLIPIGISYFTLQGIGYLINVKMGWEKAEKKLTHFLLYITYFPKFLSGPVERSNHFLPQIKIIQPFNEHKIKDGIRMILLGFFKKVVIANQIIPIINIDNSTATGKTLWIILLLQPVYLYFDFSGYTNIVLGIARTMGINLLQNFDRPFLAENMTSFWKKFHISLSQWFNDYVFKQISFKYRKWGIKSSIIGLFITWLLFGIWHGAGWNFMVLGLFQALIIVFEFLTKKVRTAIFSKLPTWIRVWAGRTVTYSLYSFSLVFFFSSDLTSALQFFSKLVYLNEPAQIGPLSTIPLSLLISLPVFIIWEIFQKDFAPQFERLHRKIFGIERDNLILRWTVYSILLTMIYIVGTNHYQFVYVNF